MLPFLYKNSFIVPDCTDMHNSPEGKKMQCHKLICANENRNLPVNNEDEEMDENYKRILEISKHQK